MADTKAEWRERLMRARRSMDAETRRSAGASAVARIVACAEFERARSVLLYVALGAEIDPHGLALHAWSAGKDVYRPTTAELPPAWTLITSDGDAAAPTDDRPATPILLIAPGVGFDAKGSRLGRGRGYYDRAIAALRSSGEIAVVGVAFEVQVVAELPRDPWDQSVDLVVTERRVLPCLQSVGPERSADDPEEVRDVT